MFSMSNLLVSTVDISLKTAEAFKDYFYPAD